MRLRSALLMSVVALVAVIVGTVLFAIQRTVDRGAREAIDRVLGRAVGSIEPVIGVRRARSAVEARVTASQPRLLALMATDAATIQDQTDEFRRTLDATFLFITDPDGKVLGSSVEGAVAFVQDTIDLGAPPDALWIRNGAVAEVHVERLTQGERALGALVVGHAVDDKAALEIYKLLGERPIIVRVGTAVVASAGLPDPHVASAIAASKDAEISAGGIRWRSASTTWPGDTAVEVVVVADLDFALAPARRLALLLYVIAALAMIAALVLALVLGGALSRPVERLVAFTAQIAQGNLAARASVHGVRELRALAGSMNKMAAELEVGRKVQADKLRLEDEMQIASRIQTSILPRRFDVARLEVAATMQPASEVGGDYYDVITVAGGAWIGIGDVAGHGLDAGLFALMAQTAIAAAVDARPDGAPRELVAAVNRILFANAWGRLGDARHMTLSLVRFHDDGRIVFAGAHMDLVVVRAGGAIETFATPGTWVGLIDDVASVTVDGELRLAADDTLILYSDGASEAADAAGVQFGLDRLGAAAAKAAGAGPQAVVDGITAAVAQHRATQEDDVTVVALRYRPVP